MFHYRIFSGKEYRVINGIFKATTVSQTGCLEIKMISDFVGFLAWWANIVDLVLTENLARDESIVEFKQLEGAMKEL